MITFFILFILFDRVVGLGVRIDEPAAGLTDDGFGRGVSLSADGTLALVSNPGAKTVYVYKLGATGSWAEQSEIKGRQQDTLSFGWSVALSDDGNRALVGDYFGERGQGRAHVFSRTGTDSLNWQLEDTLSVAGLVSLSAQSGGSEFGYQVALSGDGTVALVGARSHPVQSKPGAGAAFKFKRDAATGQWGLDAELLAGDSQVSMVQAKAAFGASVGLSRDGQVAVVGAPGHDEKRGAAFAFFGADNRRLLVRGASRLDGLGQAVAVSGDASRIVATGVWTDWFYTFHNSGPPDPVLFPAAATARFGEPVLLSDDGTVLLIGHERAEAHQTKNSGSVYVYRLEQRNWTVSHQLTAGPSNVEADSQFGLSAAMDRSGHTAIVGAPAQQQGRGAAYAFCVQTGEGAAAAAAACSTSQCSQCEWSETVFSGGTTAAAAADDPCEEADAQCLLAYLSCGGLLGVGPERKCKCLSERIQCLQENQCTELQAEQTASCRRQLSADQCACQPQSLALAPPPLFKLGGSGRSFGDNLLIILDQYKLEVIAGASGLLVCCVLFYSVCCWFVCRSRRRRRDAGANVHRVAESRRRRDRKRSRELSSFKAGYSGRRRTRTSSHRGFSSEL